MPTNGFSTTPLKVKLLAGGAESNREKETNDFQFLLVVCPPLLDIGLASGPKALGSMSWRGRWEPVFFEDTPNTFVFGGEGCRET